MSTFKLSYFWGSLHLQEISDIESTILKDSPTGKILTLSNLTLETKKNEILNSVFVFIY